MGDAQRNIRVAWEIEETSLRDEETAKAYQVQGRKETEDDS